MCGRRTLIIATCSILLAGVGVIVLGSIKYDGPNSDELNRKLQELLTTRVKTALRCAQATQAAYDAENATVNDLLTAWDHLKEARLAVASSRFETISALEEHVVNVGNTAKKIKPLHDVGAKGGEMEKWIAVKSALETAQIDLLVAQINSKN